MLKHIIRSSNKKQTKRYKQKKSKIFNSTTKKLVACYCDQCNSKEVDSKTRKRYNNLKEQLETHSYTSKQTANKISLSEKEWFQSADNKYLHEEEEELSNKDDRNLFEQFSAFNLNDIDINLNPESTSFDDL
ncbi:2244_t:CDS:2 [Funneliformis caledonium]|uniref:2244_t:CDS:1 n=1 Tax=Funneliformis caledonium TaxID=1117310 RepID=A0A9N9E5H4_9GLOM|nr:2244_t:CDS:2 [Funneliformis caledonium]